MARRENTSNTTRRSFLKGVAAGAAAGASLGLQVPAAFGKESSVSLGSAAPAGEASMQVQANRIQIETGTLSAVIDKGFLVSLKSKAGGAEFIESFDATQTAAMQLIYPSEESVGIDESRFGSISARQISPRRAEIILHSWDGDGVVAVSADPETGDLVLESAAYSSRPGVRACRWNLKGIRRDLQLVAPLFQGIKLNLDDSLIRNSRWPWPVSWEAGFAILQGASGGFWLRSEDDRYRYKALKVGTQADAYVLGLDTEAYGPVDNNLSAGGLAWRMNVFQGDWKIPASQYRDWLWRTYSLQAAERSRREWIHGVKLALCWCPGDPAILDALARRIQPAKMLIHFPDWRTDRYDENYPNYLASEGGRSFIAKGQSMGFHIMPHFNSIDMDPTNPVYTRVKDFVYRDIEKRRLQGWSWYKGRSIGVPESNLGRTEGRDKKVMVKIHPGLSMWRSILGDSILEAATKLSLENVFLDVTLNTFNLHDCWVEAMTPTEGMKRLIDHVGSLGQGLVVGGEGLNEVTAQGLSFAQAHLFKSWQQSIEGLERAGGCAVNEFLLGKLCRTIGYSGLGGRNADEELRMRIHEEHGAIPTITIRSAQDILSPNPAVKRILDRAAS